MEINQISLHQKFSNTSIHSEMKFDQILDCPVLHDKLNEFRRKGEYCDIIIAVSGQEVKAHRCVLAAASPYFESAFNSNELHFVESHDYDIFITVIDYIYSGNITIKCTNINEVLKLAHLFVLPKLKLHCAHFLEKNLNISNCYSTKNLAETYALPQLTKTVEAFIIANLNDILHENEILSFMDHKMVNIIMNKSLPLTEEMKFKLLVRWIQHDFETRHLSLPALLKNIQWNKVNVMDIYACVRESILFHENEWCMYVILHLLEENNMLSSMHVPVLQHLQKIYSSGEFGVSNDNLQGNCSININSFLESSVDVSTEDKQTNCVGREKDGIFRCESEDSDIDDIPVPTPSTDQNEQDDNEILCSVPNYGSIISVHPRSESSVSQPIKVKISKTSIFKKQSKNKRSDSKRNQGHSSKAKSNNSLMQSENQESEIFSCNLCKYTSSYNRAYYKHMKTHFSGPPFHCNEKGCDWSGDRIQQLLIHRLTHTDERPFTCPVCNMKFRSKNNLNAHIKCHTGEKPFKCDDCDRSFGTKGTLQQHKATHSNSRPYLCDTCGFSSKYQSHLIAHRRIHTGDVYSCQYPNCKYSTPKKSQLACHMRTHLSIRSFVCSTCGKGFVEKGHLVRHERIHLDNKPFSCSSCDYSSTRKDKLKEHVLKYHSSDSTTNSSHKPKKSRKQTISQTADNINQTSAVKTLKGEKVSQGATINMIISRTQENNISKGSTDTFCFDKGSTIHTQVLDRNDSVLLESQLKGALQTDIPVSQTDYTTLDPTFMGMLE